MRPWNVRLIECVKASITGFEIRRSSKAVERENDDIVP